MRLKWFKLTARIMINNGRIMNIVNEISCVIPSFLPFVISSLPDSSFYHSLSCSGIIHFFSSSSMTSVYGQQFMSLLKWFDWSRTCLLWKLINGSRFVLTRLIDGCDGKEIRNGLNGEICSIGCQTSGTWQPWKNRSPFLSIFFLHTSLLIYIATLFTRNAILCQFPQPPPLRLGKGCRTQLQ